MKYHAKVGDREFEFAFRRDHGVIRVTDGEREFAVDLVRVGDGAFSLIVDGCARDCLIDRHDGQSVVQLLGERILVAVEDDRERAASAVAGVRPVGPRTINAAMPGVVVEVRVAVGDVVADGATLLVLEAMKMQNPIHADGPGRVARLAVAKGDTVTGGQVLVQLDAVDEEHVDEAQA